MSTPTPTPTPAPAPVTPSAPVPPPPPPTLALKLSLAFPALKVRRDYDLTPDGQTLTSWTCKAVPLPSQATIDAKYAAVLAANASAAKVAAAGAALMAFWTSLTPAQQKPLLGQKAALSPLSEDTAAKLLLIVDLETSVAGLTDAQATLKAAALAACAAVSA